MPTPIYDRFPANLRTILEITDDNPTALARRLQIAGVDISGRQCRRLASGRTLAHLHHIDIFATHYDIDPGWLAFGEPVAFAAYLRREEAA